MIPGLAAEISIQFLVLENPAVPCVDLVAGDHQLILAQTADIRIGKIAGIAVRENKIRRVCVRGCVFTAGWRLLRLLRSRQILLRNDGFHGCGFGFRQYLVQENRGYSVSNTKKKL